MKDMTYHSLPVAIQFCDYLQQQGRGCIRRSNQAMKDGLHELTADTVQAIMVDSEETKVHAHSLR